MAFQTYMVKAGDTLNGIAQKFGTTVSALLDLNPDITNPDRIFVGQVINIKQISQSGGGDTVTDFAIVVNINGGSARSSDSGVKPTRDTTGVYSVTFPQNISSWLWQATLGAADDTPQVGGQITAELGTMGSTDIVTVRTFDAAGNPANRPFHLRVHDL
jgi:LysM repeat protein